MELEIRTSLRPERPGTTPKGNVRQRESKERKGEREQKTGRTEKGKGNEGAKANDTEGQTHPTHKQTRERERGKITKRWRQVVTPSVRSRRQRGVEQDQKGSGQKETIKRRGTDSPGPVCGQKSQVPSNGNKETKTEGGQGGRGMLGQSTDTVGVVISQEITKQ